MAAIDRGDKDYLRRHCSTSKNTVNKLFANTRDSFATVAKNAAGRKRVMNATTLARAIYCFATAPTKEDAAAHHAVIEVLLKHCGVTVGQQKDDFLHFMTVDAWQMARMIPEVPSDPSPHSPLKRRWLLARLLLQADPNWLLAPNPSKRPLRRRARRSLQCYRGQNRGTHAAACRAWRAGAPVSWVAAPGHGHGGSAPSG